MRTVPIPGAEGGPIHWFGTFTDIEDQKRAEEALRRREKLDSIGLLAGGIAHDFNNLLAGIMCGASFALDSLKKDHSAYPMLEIVVRSSEKAALLTQQLLAYAGQSQIFLEPADISSIVREACELVRPSIPQNIRLAIETDDHIPFMQTNASQMRQVIANLVLNAVEAIGEGEGAVAVSTAIEPLGLSLPESSVPESGEQQSNVLGYDLPAGQYVSVEVSDSGPGMDKQILKQIFDPFFTTKFTGRGLGLAVVQGVVRSLGGSIRVSSTPGAGSAFRVLVPLREAITDAVVRIGALNSAGSDGTPA